MMKKYIPYLIMLLIIILDALGDGLRTNGNQSVHHIVEISWVVLLFAVWKLSDFKWSYAIVYVLCRIWAFNLVYNIVAGNPISYLSPDSNWYDGTLIWIGEKTHQDPVHFLFIFSFMALVSTVGVIIKVERR